MQDLSGKVAWVTGASSGIGKAIALELGKRGAAVILSGRNAEALAACAQQIEAAHPGQDSALQLPFDTTDFAAIPKMVEQACAWRGGVDILVNNAGISQRSLALDTDFSVYQKIIAVDLLAPIALTQALLAQLVGRGDAAIINISSVAGKVGAPLRTAYSAAKHGLIGYGDALRTEVAASGVSVLTVAPGSVRTNVSRNALNGDGSIRGKSDAAIENGIDPDDCARQILEALAEGKREIVIAAGMEAAMPQMRATEPDKLFDLMEQLVAGGYAEKME